MDDAKKEYLRRRIAPEASYEDLLAFPRHFEIETVNACNARCPMCTIVDWTRHTPTMKDALFDKIVSEITPFAPKLKRVSLYRDGEPLLDKKLPDRIARLKAIGVSNTDISTNVSLLDDKRSRALLKAGLDQVILSIDSMKKDVFEAIRVRLNFEEVVENAKTFIRLRDEIRPQTRIRVRMVRQETNETEWPAYEAYWRPLLKQPDDRVDFHNIHNWGSQLKDFKAVAESFQEHVPCVALWSLMVIFANGEVPLCNVDYGNKYPTGNVATTPLLDVWRSKIMNERRRLHLNGQRNEIRLCQGCNVWDEPSDVEQLTRDFVTKGVLAPAAAD
ncbi:MAG: radical SAM protein [Proteobacteria bacterium]|nr:radical SAM protein [Pseudomonadota bacterium]